ncbi:hypothetical protein [Halarcobacter sp.]|uniref:hypothetical protein n=1 Tax=Halarcobacter sp. TaxID=2321133 RepID=UPI0029F59606|nr:hypothetical protein [Halarcobacter sp.]
MTQQEFFFNTPIYTPLKIESVTLLDLTSSSKEFEGYNPWQKVESTFVVEEGIYPPFIRNGGYETIEVRCKRTDSIFKYYILWVPKEQTIVKIGQYPSIADFHISEIKQYKKLLSTEKLKEFTRAIGLAANGVGIGSFVYLRRIFEYLIEDAYTMCKKDGTVDEENYKKSRMDQKIELLSSHLPDFLVEHKSMYSILSKGIHELDEKTCLAHFDSLRVGIEIILDEKLEELKKKEKIEQAKKKLMSIQV